MSEPIDDPYRPFVAVDDGTYLVLRRRRSLADWLMRGCMYVLLLLVLGLFALIPFAAWHRGRGVKDLLLAIVLLAPTWFVLRLALLAFRLEGVLRISAGPDGLALDGRGAVLRRRERVTGIAAIEATTITNHTRYGDVRWLRLSARTGSSKTDLGYFALDRDAEPAREAAAREAAATLAKRLGVPLELDGQH